jgi:hypothetical protein
MVYLLIGGGILKRKLAVMLAVMMLLSVLSGCKNDSEPSTQSTTGMYSGDLSPEDPTLDTTEDSKVGWILDSKLYCQKVAIYSGQFVEDMTDRKIENAAVVLITNRSERYLDIAILSCKINGKDAEFKVTGLPAGKSAWVLESSGMQISENPEITFVDSVVAHRDGVVSQPEEVSVSSQGNSLKATNQSDRTLYNVYVYYKVLHTDGNYLGGITYGVGFGDLEPGQSAESLAGHYIEGKTQIIRMSWLDAPLSDVKN